jgi:hypothetical protein
MRKLGVVAVAVAFVGCGGDESSVSAEERLLGKWGLQSSANACVEMFAFEGDSIEVLDLCELEDGSYGAQSTTGTYFVGDGTFTWTPEQSSCDSLPVTKETVAFAFVGDQLRLKVPSRVLLLDRADKSNTSTDNISVAYGCYDADGTFTPNPVGPL